ncbi:CYTH domain-containing protein [Aestuariispira insulae]|uniref:Adenylate cyclase n=1 Tax=Aestuariispira insulae TaxID=1461337 RepID=A0A3D9H8K0_9PROT|nr:CYTH domain-containing protein [Aestuariispira insulae]RED45797.1 adenylate cyclase [Aestuariispira insulae]
MTVPPFIFALFDYDFAMIEIERKFLVRHTNWGQPESSRRIEQGYLFIAEGRSMRVRRTGEAYEMTLKVQGEGLMRHEINTDIDAAQGQKILDELCVEPPIQKTRHVIAFAGKTWEVDVFDGANDGLIMAEIELSSEDEQFDLPDWIGPEVTDDDRFFNSALSSHPFQDWGVSYDDLIASKEAA